MRRAASLCGHAIERGNDVGVTVTLRRLLLSDGDDFAHGLNEHSLQNDGK